MAHDPSAESSVAELEVHVLGHPKSGGPEGHEGQLGACPFSHRALLLLEERQLPYVPNYVDAQQKPEWVAKASPGGTLPILRDRATGQLIPDSDAISDFLEAKFGSELGGGAHLGSMADCPQPAPRLWPAFLAFLSAPRGGQDEDQARGELRQQLQELEAAVPNQRPYLGGGQPCASDLALAPRAYLARAGCRLLKGWDWGDEFENVKAYLHRMTGRPAWRNTASWDDESICADLQRKVGKE